MIIEPTQANLQAAKEMGKFSFGRGVKAPCLDREFMRAFSVWTGGQEIGAGLPYLKQWQVGFHEANLEAPIA